jgi:hypothetical protein
MPGIESRVVQSVVRDYTVTVINMYQRVEAMIHLGIR